MPNPIPIKEDDSTLAQPPVTARKHPKIHMLRERNFFNVSDSLKKIADHTKRNNGER